MPNALSALLGDDFQFRNAGAEFVSKTDFLKAATSAEGDILSVGSENMRVQLHGDIAILSGTQIAIVQLKDGKKITGRRHLHGRVRQA